MTNSLEARAKKVAGRIMVRPGPNNTHYFNGLTNPVEAVYREAPEVRHLGTEKTVRFFAVVRKELGCLR